MSTEREVRLRAEFAELYPEAVVEVWVPAREFTEAMVRRASTTGALNLTRRMLEQRHFKFRGGAPQPRPRRARTRQTDPRGRELT